MDDMNEGFLRITNHQDHPTNNAYKVFFFYIKEQADFFESLLKEKGIKYESGEDEKNGKPIYMFGVLQTDLNVVKELNYLALGKYRRPIFGSKLNQYFILVIGAAILLFALISFMMNKN